jgi:hypothetical protein
VEGLEFFTLGPKTPQQLGDEFGMQFHFKSGWIMAQLYADLRLWPP